MRSVLLHCHLFKNAGTTIDGALQRSFGAGFLEHRDDAVLENGGMPYLERLLAQERQFIAISSHHMPFQPDYTSTAFDVWQLVMLRDPISRALSVYRYERMQPSHVSIGAKMVKKMSMRDYFGWRLQKGTPASLRNYQLRYLAARQDPNAIVGAPELKLATGYTQRSRVLIGLVERFEESMVLFEHLLAKDFPAIDLSYVKRNISTRETNDVHGHLRSELGETMYQELLAQNTFDAHLYADIGAALDAHVADVPDFRSRLSSFRERCSALQNTVDRSLNLMNFGWRDIQE